MRRAYLSCVCFQSIYINKILFIDIDIGGGSVSTQNMFCSSKNYGDISFVVDDGACDDEEDEFSKNENFRTDLKKWALFHNTSHMALKDLMKIVNKRFVDKDASSSILPEDPRTLLKTPQTISLIPLNDGEYWHYGLKKCLEKIFGKLDKPITISVTINIDGLPLFKSSKNEFWPILFNIAEMPNVPAMVIGIFCGKTKASDIDSFLTPFVDELNEMMANGLLINSHRITVRVRCILCDSPARAYIKGINENIYAVNAAFPINKIIHFAYVHSFAGVASYNGHHGCLKCTTIGEYSHVSHTNIFPRTIAKSEQTKNFGKNCTVRITKWIRHC